MTRVKVGVVGVGVMGLYHALQYLRLPEVELVGVCDNSAERLAIVTSQLRVPGWRDYRELVGRVDVVSLAVPTSLHYPLALDLLRSGIHLLVEKPITTTVEEAEELAELSQRLGLVLQVGHIMRFYPSVRELPSLVRQPVCLQARRMGPNGRVTDIGVILDLMIHDIDIILGLTDSEIEVLHVVGAGRRGLEDFAQAQIGFRSGCLATLTASRLSQTVVRTLEITQPGEVIWVDFGDERDQDFVIHRGSSTDYAVSDGGRAYRTHSRTTVERVSMHRENPLRLELAHFIGRVRGLVEPIATMEDDLKALRLAVRMQREMHLVEVPRLQVPQLWKAGGRA
ncbi:MAG: Gfo/Idh/MocA family oxidoreductase [Deinococcus sp.]|nr:Gfo/Idh/MocA family oxidoreductase [Deinococcus sp.]